MIITFILAGLLTYRLRSTCQPQNQCEVNNHSTKLQVSAQRQSRAKNATQSTVEHGHNSF